MENLITNAVDKGVGKLKGYVPFYHQLAATQFKNRSDYETDVMIRNYKKKYPSSKIKFPKEKDKTYEAPSDINFAKLSQAAYKQNAYIPNYKFIQEFSSPDRSVYQHLPSGHVIIAYRGTDTKNWRDLTTDALLALGKTQYSQRFSNADQATQKVLKKYGKQNVSLTGHSLGGSQALHISRKYGVNAHVFNPHVSWNESLSGTYYKHAHIYRNVTDPVPSFSHGAHFKSTTTKSNQAAGFGLPQHNLKFWVNEFTKRTAGKYTTS